MQVRKENLALLSFKRGKVTGWFLFSITRSSNSVELLLKRLLTFHYFDVKIWKDLEGLKESLFLIRTLYM